MPYRAVPQHSFAPCRAATAGWWACRCSRRGRCSGLPDTRLAEWLIEHGIGETRAVLIELGQIVEAIVERDDAGLRAGAAIVSSSFWDSVYKYFSYLVFASSFNKIL